MAQRVEAARTPMKRRTLARRSWGSRRRAYQERPARDRTVQTTRVRVAYRSCDRCSTPQTVVQAIREGDMVVATTLPLRRSRTTGSPVLSKVAPASPSSPVTEESGAGGHAAAGLSTPNGLASRDASRSSALQQLRFLRCPRLRAGSRAMLIEPFATEESGAPVTESVQKPRTWQDAT